MTALARVDWPAVFGRLLDEGDEELRERALYYAGLRSSISPPVAAFAAAVSTTPYLGVFRALGDDLDANTAFRIASWLQDVGHIVLTAAGSQGDPRPPLPPAAPGLLVVDPDLEWLPLLDLAADVARDGGLAVEVGTLRPGTSGLYDFGTRRITLDVAQGAGEKTFAHELGHALDPLIGRRQAPELDERFAYAMEPLLLAERPSTVTAAAPLIEACVTRVGGVLAVLAAGWPDGDTEGLPEPGVHSLLAFFNLPVIVKG